MRDVEKIVKLGREFAEPWRKATKILSVLLVLSLIGLIAVTLQKNTVTIQADYNTESEITQTQG